jgi:hypothetical protein
MAAVILGVDPHKGSHTVVAVDIAEAGLVLLDGEARRSGRGPC